MCPAHLLGILLHVMHNIVHGKALVMHTRCGAAVAAVLAVEDIKQIWLVLFPQSAVRLHVMIEGFCTLGGDDVQAWRMCQDIAHQSAGFGVNGAL